MRNRSLKYGVGIELFFLFSLIGFCILLTGWTFNIKPQFWFSTPLNSYGDGQLLEFLLQNQFLNDSRLLGLDRISNIGWPGGTFLELYPQNDELFVLCLLPCSGCIWPCTCRGHGGTNSTESESWSAVDHRRCHSTAIAKDNKLRTGIVRKSMKEKPETGRTT